MLDFLENYFSNFGPSNVPKWIWSGDVFAENHWIEIRKTFVFDSVVSKMLLHISVDTDYCLWLNGRFVGTGQFRDYPQDKKFDTFEVDHFLKTGANCLSILVFYQGLSTSVYRKGKAGLIFWLSANNAMLISDRMCKVRTSLVYQSGPMDLVTPQLSFVINCDGRKCDGWQSINYNDSHWQNASEVGEINEGYWKKLVPRPLPKVVISEPLEVTLVQSGGIVRLQRDGSLAEITAKDELLIDAAHQNIKLVSNQTQPYVVLPAEKNTDGKFLIIDLGAENFGYFELELTSACEAVIDIAHGEHLKDGRVRCNVGGRNFVDRYICRKGYQKWIMPMRRLGCRFIELHITQFDKPLTIYYVGIRPVSYPLQYRGRFECNDEVHNQIYKISRRTLELCMHEHYEDCPWREQALYSMDSRIQALCGYYVFGEYDFPEESLRLLGKGLREDNFLELTAPGEVPVTIPCFSMVWVVEILQHYMYSGRTTLLDEFLPQIKKMLNGYISGLNESGLLLIFTDTRYWNFYEWSDGLDGTEVYNKSVTIIHSCLNLFLLEALNNMYRICSLIDDQERVFWGQAAKDLQKSIYAMYLKEGKPFFVNSNNNSEVYSQLTQSLALCQSVVGEPDAGELRRKIAFDSLLSPATLSMSIFVYEALLQDSKRYGDHVINDIYKKWGYMLDNGATSFWETIKGSDDFDGAGSLCHGWSSVPAYIYQAYVLGIKPLSPGFKEFSVNPLVDVFDEVSGVVPTPAGDIRIKWHKDDGDLKLYLDHPGELKAVFSDELSESVIIKKYLF